MKGMRGLGLVVVVNTAGAVIPTILLQLFTPGATSHDLWNHFRFSLVYSYCIGTLAFAVMERLAERLHCRSRIWYVAAMLISLAVLAVVGSLTANLIFLAIGWATKSEFASEFVGGTRIAVFITILIGAALTVYETLSHHLREVTEELQTRQLAEERARQLATEARLSSLESRIHPHFLFNTLNSISALIREDPRAAERTVERLASLLRYSLDANARGLVPLRQETHIVQDYLEIEKTRFGDRLRYSVETPDALADFDVPPLSVQTLVENSIKHAIAVSRQGGEVRFAARLDAGRLVLEVSDDGPGFDALPLHRGHGLENLQERLTALFDGDGRLEIARRDGRTVASVILPARKLVV
ncbi:MAG: sensor histidine kinase [Bryobacteraceae bacterium]|jgi:sensor histidine kinase YesM